MHTIQSHIISGRLQILNEISREFHDGALHDCIGYFCVLCFSTHTNVTM